MDIKQIWKMYYRWSLLGTFFIGIFWLIYYIYYGDIPYAIGAPERNFIFMSYKVSRVWDVVIFPVFTGLMLFFMSRVKSMEACEWIETVFVMSAVSVIMGLINILPDIYSIFKAFLFAVATFLGLIYILYAILEKKERRLFEWWFSGVLIAGLSLGVSCGIMEMIELYIFCFLLWLAEVIFIKMMGWMMKSIGFILCKIFRTRNMNEIENKFNLFLWGK